MAALYLIDGSFELFRCYYGAPKAQLDSGAEVAAVRALFRTLAALLREPELTHAAIAFDDVSLLVAREASDTVLIQSQYDAALETARALGVTLWQMSEYQADDAIATAAHRFRSDPVLDGIVICSSDNDFAQCVRGERVVLLNRIKRERTDEAGVVAKFGVGPGFIPEYLGLVGDPSDGIPGIAGFGRKSAAAAISRFGRLEDFPEDPAEWESLEVRGRQKLARDVCRQTRRGPGLPRSIDQEHRRAAVGESRRFALAGGGPRQSSRAGRGARGSGPEGAAADVSEPGMRSRDRDRIPVQTAGTSTPSSAAVATICSQVGSGTSMPSRRRFCLHSSSISPGA